jgi:hypothetical protein
MPVVYTCCQTIEQPEWGIEAALNIRTIVKLVGTGSGEWRVEITAVKLCRGSDFLSTQSACPALPNCLRSVRRMQACLVGLETSKQGASTFSSRQFVSFSIPASHIHCLIDRRGQSIHSALEHLHSAANELRSWFAPRRRPLAARSPIYTYKIRAILSKLC